MAWESGDRVIVRGEHWRVLRTASFSDCAALDLVSQDRPGVNRTLLVPFDRPRRASPPRLKMVSTRRWREEVAGIVAESFPYGSLRCCPRTIRLLPYQLEPALAVFRHGATRLLIADDVGVGKTVEAGLIIGEVAGRSHGARILILVPASLKDQWQHELHTLFGIEAIDAGARWLHTVSGELPADVNPWSLPGIYLASTDFVKRAEALRPLEDVRWDLLVLDEAHATTPGSHRRIAIHALACRARLVVLLTATPHAGDDRQFDELCSTGRVEPWYSSALRARPPVRSGALRGPASDGVGESEGRSPSDLVCFRRSRADVLPEVKPPRSRVIRVRLSDAERHVHRELESYTSRLWATAAGRADANPALLATILRKRALSSAGSLVVSLRRRLQLMDEPAADEVQLWLPLSPDDEERGSVEDLPADGIVGGAGLGDQVEERVGIERILEAAKPACESESKIRALLRLLRRVREPAIVFTEYRDTADRLCDALTTEGHRMVVLHGGHTAVERRTAIEDFNRGDALLVATDAASEGLNLQHRCRLVIHFELPWTPSRLHQRCGRVNRIGQSRPVHEVALIADDTAERLVIDPLVRRAARAGCFGVAPLTAQLPEIMLSERLHGGVDRASTHTDSIRVPRGLVSNDLRDEGIAEATRLELLRRLGRRPRSSQGRPMLPAAHAGRATTRSVESVLTVVVTITIRDRMGGPLEERTVAVSGTVPGFSWQPGRVERQLPSVLEQIVPRVLRRLARRAGPRLSQVRALHDNVRHVIERREAAIESSLRSAARELVQVGLFDRLARRAATRRPGEQVLCADVEESPPMILRARVRLRGVFCGRLE
jgi:superfamily II DNA or RNA helicase